MDLNGDDIDDVITGDYTPGDVHFFEGTADGFKASVVIEEVIPEDDADDQQMWRWMSASFFTDWDGDGDFDMIVGNVKGDVFVNINEGTPHSFRFGARVPVTAGGEPIKVIQKSHPIPVDWNRDGILDLLVGDEATGVTFFRGNPDRTFEPGISVFSGQTISLEGGFSEVYPKMQEDTGIDGYRVRLAVADWNDDGKLDLLVGYCTQGDDGTGSNIYVYLRK